MIRAIYVALLAMTSLEASADSSSVTGPPHPQLVPDPPSPRTAPVSVGPDRFRPSWDLDGLYLWLGPTGAASVIDADWDTTFGGDLAVVRVRERQRLSALGVDIGAALWTARGGGRIWVDTLLGTRLGSRIYGVSAGPLVELSQLQHPRLGGSVGVWGFFGITPYARVGVVDELGIFVDVGVHIALPVFRY